MGERGSCSVRLSRKGHAAKRFLRVAFDDIKRETRGAVAGRVHLARKTQRVPIGAIRAVGGVGDQFAALLAALVSLGVAELHAAPRFERFRACRSSSMKSKTRCIVPMLAVPFRIRSQAWRFRTAICPIVGSPMLKSAAWASMALITSECCIPMFRLMSK